MPAPLTMTAPSPSVPQTVPLAATVEMPPISAAEIDRSCRMAVLVLFLAGATWLAVGGLLGVISAIKAHAPGFLAGPAWLTYGRVRAVGANAIVYGFVLQAGLGLALWMICRLGRNRLEGARMITAAALFWNLGLIIGFLGILAGGSTGYEWLEIPGFASPVLFCAYILIGAWALVTLHLRNARPLYVSQWLLLASLLWFGWVYATAQVFLVLWPARGVMQAVVNGWYVHNLFELCLAPFGLASIFYFLPKLLGRPLHSRQLALFGFWLLVFAGGWGGLRFGQPVSNWLASVTMVGRVFLLIALLAFGMSWYGTLAGRLKLAWSDHVLRFLLVGAGSYLLAAALETIGTHPAVSSVTLFTLYDQGVIQLKTHGFLAMTLAGAIYYVTPRLAGCEWPAPRLIQFHFWCSVVGVALMAIALLVGGLIQGAGIGNPQTDFMQVVRRTVPFLGTSTLGATLLFIAYAAFGINLGRLLTVYCPCAAIWSFLRNSRAEAVAAGRTKA